MVRVYRVRFGLWLGPAVRPKVTVKFGVRARVISGVATLRTAIHLLLTYY